MMAIRAVRVRVGNFGELRGNFKTPACVVLARPQSRSPGRRVSPVRRGGFRRGFRSFECARPPDQSASAPFSGRHVGLPLAQAPPALRGVRPDRPPAGHGFRPRALGPPPPRLSRPASPAVDDDVHDGPAAPAGRRDPRSPRDRRGPPPAPPRVEHERRRGEGGGAARGLARARLPRDDRLKLDRRGGSRRALPRDAPRVGRGDDRGPARRGVPPAHAPEPAAVRGQPSETRRARGHREVLQRRHARVRRGDAPRPGRPRADGQRQFGEGIRVRRVQARGGRRVRPRVRRRRVRKRQHQRQEAERLRPEQKPPRAWGGRRRRPGGRRRGRDARGRRPGRRVVPPKKPRPVVRRADRDDRGPDRSDPPGRDRDAGAGDRPR